MREGGSPRAATRGDLVAAIVPDVDYDDPWLPVVGYSKLVALASQLLRVMDIANKYFRLLSHYK